MIVEGDSVTCKVRILEGDLPFDLSIPTEVVTILEYSDAHVGVIRECPAKVIDAEEGWIQIDLPKIRGTPVQKFTYRVRMKTKNGESFTSRQKIDLETL